MSWWRQLLWSTGTAAVSAMTAVWLLPPLVVATMFGILVIHESGHYWCAWEVGARPRLPWFVPFGYWSLGVTSVDGLTANTRVPVAAAGPAAGLVATAMFVVAGILTGLGVVTLVASVAFVGETVMFLIGRDGHILRGG